jgi:hypothetical protein
MPLKLGVCNNRSGNDTRECASRYAGRLHADANVFRWKEKQRLRVTGSVAPTARVKAGGPRTLTDSSRWRRNNCYRGLTAALKQRIKLPNTRRLKFLFPKYYARSSYIRYLFRPLSFTNAILQMATTSVLCGRLLLTPNAVGRRHVFRARLPSTPATLIWTRGNPDDIRELWFHVRFILRDIIAGSYYFNNTTVL